MKLFFSVGEPSGDLHGANLIRALEDRAGKIETLGLGGPRMAAAGCNLLRDMTDLAIMGIWPALVKLPLFLKLLARVEQTLKSERPDAVILIDYPGFNWHVAKKAKALGIPVVYYGLPQLWAWASWRVKKVRAYIDHPLCKLPFEEKWFHEQGCSATTYVGHPYFDELKNRQLDESFLAGLQTDSRRIVTILPGSRRSEVTKNFASQVQAAELIHSAVPDVRFAVASYNDQQAAMASQILGASKLPIEIIPGKTPELIHAATCTLAVSGSVSLELLYHAKPSVIQYILSPLTYYAAKSLARIKYMSLVNLLVADELHPRVKVKYSRNSPHHANVLFPEYPDWHERSADVASHAIEWLQDEPLRLELVRKLEALRGTLAIGGASANAAEYIATKVLRTGKQRKVAA